MFRISLNIVIHLHDEKYDTVATPRLLHPPIPTSQIWGSITTDFIEGPHIQLRGYYLGCY